MPFRIIRNDITKVRADAIVNTANPDPVYASGTDAAVYRAAGAEQLLEERRKIGKIGTGEAAVTPAFALPARYIIHTVGPIWQGGGRGEFENLASCYRKSLLLARQLGCRSIAFPLISTGVYGFPKDKALSVALEVVADFLENEEMDVTLVVFDKKAFELTDSLVEGVRQYIDDRYVSIRSEEEYGSEWRRRRLESLNLQKDMEQSLMYTGDLPDLSDYEELADAQDICYHDALPCSADIEKEPLDHEFRPSSLHRPKKHLSDVMLHVGENFQERLLRLIDERGMTDTQVYKRANVDRKLFSKIRCNADYTPRKTTAVALAIALELNLDETTDLLRRAGIALSPSSKFDLIVEYCIENHIYNIFDINAILFEYDQPMLGC